jgi:hypothetical protein
MAGVLPVAHRARAHFTPTRSAGRLPSATPPRELVPFENSIDWNWVAFVRSHVRWKSDPDGNGLPEVDKSDPLRTHLSDALGYFLTYACL